MSVPPARRSLRSILIMLVCLMVYGAFDLGSKEWALDNLSRARAGDPPPVCVPDEHGGVVYQRVPLPSHAFIPGVLRLTYAENCGAAFSMLRTAPAWLRGTVFGLATVGASVMLIFMFVRGVGGKMFAAAVPFILAGALGNLADRIRHGFVVDFFQVDPALFVYPVFNVADVVIVVGVGLLLIDGMLKPRPDGKSELARSHSAS